MSTSLPPLAAVKVFEAAARHKSFTRAAEELGMTQAAVSYQIKILEERIGSPLFLRHARGVELTDNGTWFSRRSSEAMDILRDAYSEVRGRSEKTLVISVIPTFAANFLAQRLGEFQCENPSIAVRIDMNSALADFTTDNVDVAVRSGSGNWPGLRKHLLLRAKFTPMLSPSLAETIGGVHEPADLLKLPIIAPAEPWWQIWFEKAGLPEADLDDQSNLKLDSQLLEANAAIAGLGVSMLTPEFYQDAIAQKQLLQPFDLIGDEDEDYGYWLVYPESRRNSPAIKTFRNWILQEITGFI